jgi:pimeloyl-ACP methyl ester carboxylesterase
MLRKTVLALIFLAVGLFSSSAQAQATHTFVLHLNGIGGERSMDRWLVQGLAQGGLDAKYQIYDWTGDEAGMLALTDVKLHKAESAKVAQMITDDRRQHPADRFILTCHSGGAAIAAWALAQLPVDISIDTWVMLEPALSPEFDLSKALAHVTGKTYAFSSINDAIVLGAGTRLMGTMDRINTDAAGLVGFKRPPSGDRVEYEKLVNIRYDTAWMRFGDMGDHIGPLLRPFARNVIAPLLLDGVLPKFKPLVPATEPAGTSASSLADKPGA